MPEPTPETGTGPLASWLGDLLLGIDHVGLAVDDLDGELRRWSAFGLQERHRETNHDQHVIEVMLAVAAGTTRVQLISPLDDGHEGEPATEASPVARFLRRRGPGLHHLAYAVSDIERATARLAGAGVPLLYSGARTGTAGSKINFVHPRYAGGVLVELVEPSSPTG